MKSQNHRAAFYLCASILLFALALIVPSVSAQSGGGLNVLSMDVMDYSWSGEVQEDAWTLLITQSSEGERIHAVFDKEEITIKDPITGEQGFATHDIEISMRPISTACNYRIEPKTDLVNPHVYTASVYTIRCGLFSCNWHGDSVSLAQWKHNCEAGGGDFRENEQGIGGQQQVLACFYLNDEGTHGVLQTPAFDFTTEVIVTKKGLEESRIGTSISNHNKAAYLGQYGYIEWVGSLASGEYCPMRDIPDATYNPATGWTLTDSKGYTEYSSHYPTQWEECKSDFVTHKFQDSASAINHAQRCVNSLNGVAGKALTPKAITDPIVLNANIDGSIVKANIKSSAILYPTYKLILASSWVGIYVPKPEPGIANVRTDWETSTQRGKLMAEIKNVGDEGGDFTYGVTCEYPAQVIEPDRSGYWNEEEVKTVEFLITGAVREETRTSCTLHAYATKYPEIREESETTIILIPLPTPTPTPAPTKTMATSLPAGAGDAAHSKEVGGRGEGAPTSTFLPYGILGLVFIGIIVIAFLWRRSGTKVPASAEPGGAEAKRPSSAKWIAAIIILLLIVGLGLFVVTSLKQPEVSLKNVSVKGFESINLLIVEIPTEVIFSVVLEVYNPNFLGATVTDVEYDLYLNDVYVGKGSLPRAVIIPANGKTNVETEVSVSISSSVQALVTTIQQGSATAKVTGNVYIGVPIRGSISVPFSEEQRLV